MFQTHHRVRPALALMAIALSFLLVGSPVQAGPGDGPPGRSSAPLVLVYQAAHATEVQRAGTAALARLGREGPRRQRFDVEATGDPAVFTGSRLRRYNSVVFLGAYTGALDTAQEAALQAYIRSGGGFLGIGDAARAQPGSDWFTGLIGSRPAAEPTTVRPGIVEVPDRVHPATASLPLEWQRSDAWPDWNPNPAGSVHTVAALRESSGAEHPISWCRDYEGGRSFYTGMGNMAAGFREAAFGAHLRGALLWTARIVRADCTATITANYQLTRVTQPNQPGQLDQIGEPHGLAIARDGRVLIIGRGGPMAGGPAPVTDWNSPDYGLGEGTVHVWDPRTKKSTKSLSLAVYGNLGSGEDELHKSEEGLLGIALDPGFERNGWVYLHYTPHSRIDRVEQTAMRRVSRFTLDPRTNLINPASERVLLEWPLQIHSCCHAGGGMAFDSHGNLYVGTGDTTASGFSDGYSANNPEPSYRGLSFADARRTAGSTNDLNGKILRIHPEANGGYTIPSGNLFTGRDAVHGRTRPEIYVMGMRNPSRLNIDPATDALTVGSVGPDAEVPSTVWGPAKYDESTVVTHAGNLGWPYCVGDNQPYRDRNLPDPTRPLGWYDCHQLRNTSPGNTGLVNLPPAEPHNIWFGPQGGGATYPRDEHGVPSYEESEATYLLPWTKGGLQAVMDGPVYRYDASSPSAVKWPRYWDGKWFVGNFMPIDGPRHAVLMDPRTAPTGGLPVHADTLYRIVPETQDTIWLLIAWQFGPDGALYVLNYGDNFFGAGPASALWRVTYTGAGPTPNEKDLVTP